MSKVTIIDYGVGNLWSVANGFKHINCEVNIASNIDEIRSAQTLVLPGVGSFRRGMESLKERHFHEELQEQVFIKKKKILGICLGMQLMAESGVEDGGGHGMGLIPGTVDKFNEYLCSGLRIPHIGYNAVKTNPNTRLYRGLGVVADFYFVHSYRIMPDTAVGEYAICHYGDEFAASYEYDNIFATQFHPEKSQDNGLNLLKNFIAA